MKRILYTGLELPQFLHKNAIHFPLIEIIPAPLSQLNTAFKDFSLYTDLIFTSKTAVDLFVKACNAFNISLKDLQKKSIYSVGEKTQDRLQTYHVPIQYTAKEETAEGIVKLLDLYLDKEKAYVFWPHSALSRPVLSQFLHRHHIRFQQCHLYTTVTTSQVLLPDLSQIEEVYLTSPSTVRAFFERYPSFPSHLKFRAIGPITQAALDACQISMNERE